MIKDEFISTIPSDFNLGGKYILDAIIKFHNENHKQPFPYHDTYVEYYALLEAYLESNNYKFKKN